MTPMMIISSLIATFSPMSAKLLETTAKLVTILGKPHRFPLCHLNLKIKIRTLQQEALVLLKRICFPLKP